jgi:hypothetical protein
MKSDNERFSKRFDFAKNNIKNICIINDAPNELRGVLVDIAHESGIRYGTLRSLICKSLRKRENTNNWSDYNIQLEIYDSVDGCEWYEVYDLIEEIFRYLFEASPQKNYDYIYFQDEINKYFIKEGIGWKLEKGILEIRGNEAYEKLLKDTKMIFSKTNKNTAKSEIEEAIKDLSKRPNPDITGSIQHSIAALECIARDFTGNNSLTLGDILKRNPTMIPKPLDNGITKIWGYASEFGRHLKEGKAPTLREAKLVVGLSLVISTYLIEKKEMQ